MTAQAQIPNKFTLDDEWSGTDNSRLFKIFYYHYVIVLLQPGEKFPKSLLEVYFCDIADLGQSLEHLEKTFVKVRQSQPSKHEFVVAYLRV